MPSNLASLEEDDYLQECVGDTITIAVGRTKKQLFHGELVAASINLRRGEISFTIDDGAHKHELNYETWGSKYWLNKRDVILMYLNVQAENVPTGFVVVALTPKPQKDE